MLLLLSRFDSTLANVAWMSPVVRHRFAMFAIHLPQLVGSLQYSMLSTMGRPPPAMHASMPWWNRIHDVFSTGRWVPPHRSILMLHSGALRVRSHHVQQHDQRLPQHRHALVETDGAVVVHILLLEHVRPRPRLARVIRLQTGSVCLAG